MEQMQADAWGGETPVGLVALDPRPPVVAAPAFEVLRPAALSTPLVFASPHSGRLYPREMVAASVLCETELRRSEDAFVDSLFAAAPSVGAPLLLARYARAYVDVNREPYEFDPALFGEPLPPWVGRASARAAAGLGSVARVVGEGREIYRGKMRFAEAEARIRSVHRPYHAALESLLEAADRRFGCAVLIDCHSMPAASVSGGPHRPPPDVVLGDRFGAACDPRVTAVAEAALRDQGLIVARNTPYAGGWSTEHYGRPKVGRHALQIEISRGLYLHEPSLRPSAGMARLTARLSAVCTALAAEDWSGLSR